MSKKKRSRNDDYNELDFSYPTVEEDDYDNYGRHYSESDDLRDDDITIDVEHKDYDIRDSYSTRRKKENKLASAIIILLVCIALLSGVYFLVFRKSDDSSVVKDGNKKTVYLDPAETTQSTTEEPTTKRIHTTAKEEEIPITTAYDKVFAEKEKKNKKETTTSSKDKKSSKNTKSTKNTKTTKSQKFTKPQKSTKSQKSTKPVSTTGYTIKNNAVYNGNKKLYEADPSAIVTIGKQTYYLHTDGDLITVHKLGSTGSMKSTANLIVKNDSDRYYFVDGKIVKLTESGTAKAVKSEVKSAAGVGKFIVYSNKHATAVINTSNGKSERISDDVISNLCTNGETIFGLNDGKLLSISPKNSKIKELDIEANAIAADSKHIYYTDKNYDLYRADFDGDNAKRISNKTEFHGIYIKEDYIYFEDYDKVPHKIKKDGSGYSKA